MSADALAGDGAAAYRDGFYAQPLARADRGAFVLFASQICVVVFLQRIAIPGVGIEIALLLMPIGLALLAFSSGLQLSRTRVILYLVMASLALISQVLVGQSFSFASVALFLVCYLPLLVRLQVQPATYFRCLSFFQNVMLLVCAIVALQDAWQFTIGWQSFPDMDRLLPDWLITQGFVYIQPLEYGSPYIKPSAFFFKEVSFCSQYLAIAFIIELVFFRRYWRMIAYLGCIFATFAGTGLLLLAITAPFLIAGLPARARNRLLLLVPAVIAVAVASGWLQQVSYRLTEYQQQDSSSYGRFIEPFISVDTYAPNLTLLSAFGAGQIPREESFVFLPVVKLMLEYGPVVTIVFYAMLINALFSGAPSRRLALGLFVLYNLMGGYFQIPDIINTMVLLGTLLRPTRQHVAIPAPGLARGLRSSPNSAVA